jgi:hypothetical protein
MSGRKGLGIGLPSGVRCLIEVGGGGFESRLAVDC